MQAIELTLLNSSQTVFSLDETEKYKQKEHSKWMPSFLYNISE